MSSHEPPALQPWAGRVALGGANAAPSPPRPPGVHTPQEAERVSREGGGLGMNLGTASLRRALTEEEGRAMGHSPSGGRRPGLAHTTQEAARCRDDAGASLKVALGRG